MKVNLYKKFSELERIQNLLKNARALVERELGRKVLEAYLQKKGKDEIFEIVKHIVSEVYGYDRIVELKTKKEQKTKTEEKRRKTKEKTREVVNDVDEWREVTEITSE